MLFASGQDASKLTVFFGAALALVLTSALGVLAGTVLSQYVSTRHLHLIAGFGFIVIGLWTLVQL